MRQLADFAVWLGLILVVVGVVYFTPMVADYVTSEPKQRIVIIPHQGSGSGHHSRISMHHHPLERDQSQVTRVD